MCSRVFAAASGILRHKNNQNGLLFTTQQTKSNLGCFHHWSWFYIKSEIAAAVITCSSCTAFSAHSGLNMRKDPFAVFSGNLSYSSICSNLSLG